MCEKNELRVYTNSSLSETPHDLGQNNTSLIRFRNLIGLRPDVRRKPSLETSCRRLLIRYIAYIVPTIALRYFTHHSLVWSLSLQPTNK